MDQVDQLRDSVDATTDCVRIRIGKNPRLINADIGHLIATLRRNYPNFFRYVPQVVAVNTTTTKTWAKPQQRRHNDVINSGNVDSDSKSGYSNDEADDYNECYEYDDNNVRGVGTPAW